MRVAVCGLGCKTAFEVESEDEVTVYVLTIDPGEEDGYREVMTFGCALCQESAATRRNILETSAAAVTVGEERDRYRGELAKSVDDLEKAVVRYVEAERHDAETAEQLGNTEELLTAQENMLAQEKEAHAITSGQLADASEEVNGE